MLIALMIALLPPLTAGQIADLRRGRVVAEATINGSAGSARALALARCSRDGVWAVLIDHEHFPEFMPHVESVQVLQRTATTERAAQAVNAVVSTIRYVLDYRFDRGRRCARRHPQARGGAMPLTRNLPEAGCW